MSERPRLEAAAAALALLVCVAFIASFALGLGGAADSAAVGAGALDAADAPPAAGRVEVLNGSGRSGIARAATAELRRGGFDVVYFGNAPASAGDSSIVIVRRGDDAVARSVGKYLGIARIATERDTTLYLDATVILGIDWMPAPEQGGDRNEGWRARLGRWLTPGR